MSAETSRHAWIVGASSGIGAALAHELAVRGWLVTVSARRHELLKTLAAAHPGMVKALPLDVTKEGAAERAWRLVDTPETPVSRVIYMAGDYAPLPLAELALEPFSRTMAINYLGAVAVLQAVVPTLCRRGRGEIVLTASLAGYRGLPRSAPYNASKAALISLAESLQPELAAAGIGMRLISPGFVRTPLTDKNAFRMPLLMQPDAAARRIADGLERSRFEIAFPRRLAWIMKLLRCLPYGLYFSVAARLLGDQRR